MNKYQEAYSYIKHYCELDDDCVKWPLYQRSIKSLKELVDKATPKKPVRFIDKFYISLPKCPICRTIPHTCTQKYCDECGQALDWSDDSE